MVVLTNSPNAVKKMSMLSVQCTLKLKMKLNKQGKTYYPNKFPKSRPTDSVIQKNINLQITRQNYKQASKSYQGFQSPQRRVSAN